jgi:hypothetical protein
MADVIFLDILHKRSVKTSKPMLFDKRHSKSTPVQLAIILGPGVDLQYDVLQVQLLAKTFFQRISAPRTRVPIKTPVCG